jgi:hypothetical protein
MTYFLGAALHPLLLGEGCYLFGLLDLQCSSVSIMLCFDLNVIGFALIKSRFTLFVHSTSSTSDALGSPPETLLLRDRVVVGRPIRVFPSGNASERSNEPLATVSFLCRLARKSHRFRSYCSGHDRFRFPFLEECLSQQISLRAWSQHERRSQPPVRQLPQVSKRSLES